MIYDPLKPGVADMSVVDELLEEPSEALVESRGKVLAQTISGGLDDVLGARDSLQPASRLVRDMVLAVAVTRLAAELVDLNSFSVDSFEKSLSVFCEGVRNYSRYGGSSS